MVGSEYRSEPILFSEGLPSGKQIEAHDPLLSRDVSAMLFAPHRFVSKYLSLKIIKRSPARTRHKTPAC